MATVAELKAALEQAANDATAEKQEVADAITALTNQVAALKTQIANGGTIAEADLDPVLASIQGIDAQVKDITTPVAPA